jgi:hypothetical protein
MMKRLRLLLAVAGTATVLVAWATPALPASATTSGDWISVTQVLVNKLGGVNVSGQVSCQGTYQQIAAGSYQYQDGQGNMVSIDLQPGDKVNMFANHDNYTVSQPSGRKSMIQVTHWSSRMNPCFVQYRFLPDGTPMPQWVNCGLDGTACRWETDNFGYDHDSLGPLFDYSADGRFKAGMLNVTGHSVGLDVMIAHFSGDTLTGWDDDFVPEGSSSTTSTSLKALNYRG